MNKSLVQEMPSEPVHIQLTGTVLARLETLTCHQPGCPAHWSWSQCAAPTLALWVLCTPSEWRAGLCSPPQHPPHRQAPLYFPPNLHMPSPAPPLWICIEIFFPSSIRKSPFTLCPAAAAGSGPRPALTRGPSPGDAPSSSDHHDVCTAEKPQPP